MFSVRIVTVNHYIGAPIPGLDVEISEFRNSRVTQVPVLRIFGSTPAGQKTCLHVHGVFPYFYVPCQESEVSDKFLQQLALSIDTALQVSTGNAGKYAQHVFKITPVSGRQLYGYRSTERQFLKIYFYNSFVIKRASDLLLTGAVLNRVFQPFEAHVPFNLQFFIDYNLYGMNLVNLATVKFRKRKGGNGDVSSRDVEMGPGPADESLMFNSVSTQHWAPSDIPGSQWLPDEVKRQSVCELEVDGVATDILNRLDLKDNVDTNPGLVAIWEDERQRREQLDQLSELMPPSSPERGDVLPQESEHDWLERLQEVVDEQLRDLRGDITTPEDRQGGLEEGKQEDIMSPLASQQSTNQPEDHLSQQSVSQPKEVEVEAVVNEDLVMSQITASQAADKELAGLLMNMGEDDDSILSPATQGDVKADEKLAVLMMNMGEDDDSILSPATQRDVKDGEDDPAVLERQESLEMSQVWERDGEEEGGDISQRDEMLIPELDETSALAEESDSEMSPLQQLDGQNDPMPNKRRKKSKLQMVQEFHAVRASHQKKPDRPLANPLSRTNHKHSTDYKGVQGMLGYVPRTGDGKSILGVHSDFPTVKQLLTTPRQTVTVRHNNLSSDGVGPPPHAVSLLNTHSPYSFPFKHKSSEKAIPGDSRKDRPSPSASRTGNKMSKRRAGPILSPLKGVKTIGGARILSPISKSGHDDRDANKKDDVMIIDGSSASDCDQQVVQAEKARSKPLKVSRQSTGGLYQLTSFNRDTDVERRGKVIKKDKLKRFTEVMSKPAVAKRKVPKVKRLEFSGPKNSTKVQDVTSQGRAEVSQVTCFSGASGFGTKLMTVGKDAPSKSPGVRPHPKRKQSFEAALSSSDNWTKLNGTGGVLSEKSSSSKAKPKNSNGHPAAKKTPQSPEIQLAKRNPGSGPGFGGGDIDKSPVNKQTDSTGTNGHRSDHEEVSALDSLTHEKGHQGGNSHSGEQDCRKVKPLILRKKVKPLTITKKKKTVIKFVRCKNPEAEKNPSGGQIPGSGSSSDDSPNKGARMKKRAGAFMKPLQVSSTPRAMVLSSLDDSTAESVNSDALFSDSFEAEDVHMDVTTVKSVTVQSPKFSEIGKHLTIPGSHSTGERPPSSVRKKDKDTQWGKIGGAIGDGAVDSLPSKTKAVSPGLGRSFDSHVSPVFHRSKSSTGKKGRPWKDKEGGARRLPLAAEKTSQTFPSSSSTVNENSVKIVEMTATGQPTELEQVTFKADQLNPSSPPLRRVEVRLRKLGLNEISMLAGRAECLKGSSESVDGHLQKTGKSLQFRDAITPDRTQGKPSEVLRITGRHSYGLEVDQKGENLCLEHEEEIHDIDMGIIENVTIVDASEDEEKQVKEDVIPDEDIAPVETEIGESRRETSQEVEENMPTEDVAMVTEDIPTITTQENEEGGRMDSRSVAGKEYILSQIAEHLDQCLDDSIGDLSLLGADIGEASQAVQGLQEMLIDDGPESVEDKAGCGDAGSEAVEDVTGGNGSEDQPCTIGGTESGDNSLKGRESAKEGGDCAREGIPGTAGNPPESVVECSTPVVSGKGDEEQERDGEDVRIDRHKEREMSSDENGEETGGGTNGEGKNKRGGNAEEMLADDDKGVEGPESGESNEEIVHIESRALQGEQLAKGDDRFSTGQVTVEDQQLEQTSDRDKYREVTDTIRDTQDVDPSLEEVNSRDVEENDHGNSEEIKKTVEDDHPNKPSGESDNCRKTGGFKESVESEVGKVYLAPVIDRGCAGDRQSAQNLLDGGKCLEMGTDAEKSGDRTSQNVTEICGLPKKCPHGTSDGDEVTAFGRTLDVNRAGESRDTIESTAGNSGVLESPQSPDEEMKNPSKPPKGLARDDKVIGSGTSPEEIAAGETTDITGGTVGTSEVLEIPPSPDGERTSPIEPRYRNVENDGIKNDGVIEIPQSPEENETTPNEPPGKNVKNEEVIGLETMPEKNKAGGMTNIHEKSGGISEVTEIPQSPEENATSSKEIASDDEATGFGKEIMSIEEPLARAANNSTDVYSEVLATPNPNKSEAGKVSGIIKGNAETSEVLKCPPSPDEEMNIPNECLDMTAGDDKVFGVKTAPEKNKAGEIRNIDDRMVGNFGVSEVRQSSDRETKIGEISRGGILDTGVPSEETCKSRVERNTEVVESSHMLYAGTGRRGSIEVEKTPDKNKAIGPTDIAGKGARYSEVSEAPKSSNGGIRTPENPTVPADDNSSSIGGKGACDNDKAEGQRDMSGDSILFSPESPDEEIGSAERKAVVEVFECAESPVLARDKMIQLNPRVGGIDGNDSQSSGTEPLSDQTETRLTALEEAELRRIWESGREAEGDAEKQDIAMSASGTMGNTQKSPGTAKMTENSLGSEQGGKHKTGAFKKSVSKGDGNNLREIAVAEEEDDTDSRVNPVQKEVTPPADGITNKPESVDIRTLATLEDVRNQVKAKLLEERANEANSDESDNLVIDETTDSLGENRGLNMKKDEVSPKSRNEDPIVASRSVEHSKGAEISTKVETKKVPSCGGSSVKASETNSTGNNPDDTSSAFRKSHKKKKKKKKKRKDAKSGGVASSMSDMDSLKTKGKHGVHKRRKKHKKDKKSKLCTMIAGAHRVPHPGSQDSIRQTPHKSKKSESLGMGNSLQNTGSSKCEGSDSQSSLPQSSIGAVTTKSLTRDNGNIDELVLKEGHTIDLAKFPEEKLMSMVELNPRIALYRFKRANSQQQSTLLNDGQLPAAKEPSVQGWTRAFGMSAMEVKCLSNASPSPDVSIASGESISASRNTSRRKRVHDYAMLAGVHQYYRRSKTSSAKAALREAGVLNDSDIELSSVSSVDRIEDSSESGSILSGDDNKDSSIKDLNRQKNWTSGSLKTGKKGGVLTSNSPSVKPELVFLVTPPKVVKDSTQIGDFQSKQPGKRGRGRPRKLIANRSEGMSLHKMVDPADKDFIDASRSSAKIVEVGAQFANVQTEPAGKRGRGRPKKHFGDKSDSETSLTKMVEPSDGDRVNASSEKFIDDTSLQAMKNFEQTATTVQEAAAVKSSTTIVAESGSGSNSSKIGGEVSTLKNDKESSASKSIIDSAGDGTGMIESEKGVNDAVKESRIPPGYGVVDKDKGKVQNIDVTDNIADGPTSHGKPASPEGVGETTAANVSEMETGGVPNRSHAKSEKDTLIKDGVHRALSALDKNGTREKDIPSFVDLSQNKKCSILPGLGEDDLLQLRTSQASDKDALWNLAYHSPVLQSPRSSPPQLWSPSKDVKPMENEDAAGFDQRDSYSKDAMLFSVCQERSISDKESSADVGGRTEATNGGNAAGLMEEIGPTVRDLFKELGTGVLNSTDKPDRNTDRMDLGTGPSIGEHRTDVQNGSDASSMNEESMVQENVSANLGRERDENSNHKLDADRNATDNISDVPGAQPDVVGEDTRKASHSIEETSKDIPTRAHPPSGASDRSVVLIESDDDQQRRADSKDGESLIPSLPSGSPGVLLSSGEDASPSPELSDVISQENIVYADMEQKGGEVMPSHRRVEGGEVREKKSRSQGGDMRDLVDEAGSNSGLVRAVSLQGTPVKQKGQVTKPALHQVDGDAISAEGGGDAKELDEQGRKEPEGELGDPEAKDSKLMSGDAMNMKILPQGDVGNENSPDTGMDRNQRESSRKTGSSPVLEYQGTVSQITGLQASSFMVNSPGECERAAASISDLGDYFGRSTPDNGNVAAGTDNSLTSVDGGIAGTVIHAEQVTVGGSPAEDVPPGNGWGGSSQVINIVGNEDSQAVENLKELSVPSMGDLPVGITREHDSTDMVEDIYTQMPLEVHVASTLTEQEVVHPSVSPTLQDDTVAREEKSGRRPVLDFDMIEHSQFHLSDSSEREVIDHHEMLGIEADSQITLLDSTASEGDSTDEVVSTKVDESNGEEKPSGTKRKKKQKKDRGKKAKKQKVDKERSPRKRKREESSESAEPAEGEKQKLPPIRMVFRKVRKSTDPTSGGEDADIYTSPEKEDLRKLQELQKAELAVKESGESYKSKASSNLEAPPESASMKQVTIPEVLPKPKRRRKAKVTAKSETPTDPGTPQEEPLKMKPTSRIKSPRKTKAKRSKAKCRKELSGLADQATSIADGVTVPGSIRSKDVNVTPHRGQAPSSVASGKSMTPDASALPTVNIIAARMPQQTTHVIGPHHGYQQGQESSPGVKELLTGPAQQLPLTNPSLGPAQRGPPREGLRYSSALVSLSQNVPAQEIPPVSKYAREAVPRAAVPSVPQGMIQLRHPGTGGSVLPGHIQQRFLNPFYGNFSNVVASFPSFPEYFQNVVSGRKPFPVFSQQTFQQSNPQLRGFSSQPGIVPYRELRRVHAPTNTPTRIPSVGVRSLIAPQPSVESSHPRVVPGSVKGLAHLLGPTSSAPSAGGTGDSGTDTVIDLTTTGGRKGSSGSQEEVTSPSKRKRLNTMENEVIEALMDLSDGPRDKALKRAARRTQPVVPGVQPVSTSQPLASGFEFSGRGETAADLQGGKDCLPTGALVVPSAGPGNKSLGGVAQRTKLAVAGVQPVSTNQPVIPVLESSGRGETAADIQGREKGPQRWPDPMPGAYAGVQSREVRKSSIGDIHKGPGAGPNVHPTETAEEHPPSQGVPVPCTLATSRSNEPGDAPACQPNSKESRGQDGIGHVFQNDPNSTEAEYRESGVGTPHSQEITTDALLGAQPDEGTNQGAVQGGESATEVIVKEDADGNSRRTRDGESNMKGDSVKEGSWNVNGGGCSDDVKESSEGIEKGGGMSRQGCDRGQVNNSNNNNNSGTEGGAKMDDIAKTLEQNNLPRIVPSQSGSSGLKEQVTMGTGRGTTQNNGSSDNINKCREGNHPSRDYQHIELGSWKKGSNITESTARRNVFVPVVPPPTRAEIQASLSKHGLTQYIHRAPYWEKRRDVPTFTREAANMQIHLNLGLPAGLKEACPPSSATGLNHWRTLMFVSDQPEALISRDGPLQSEEGKVVMKALLQSALSKREVVLTPSKLPPTRCEVLKWLRRRCEANLERVDKGHKRRPRRLHAGEVQSESDCVALRTPGDRDLGEGPGRRIIPGGGHQEDTPMEVGDEAPPSPFLPDMIARMEPNPPPPFSPTSPLSGDTQKTLPSHSTPLFLHSTPVVHGRKQRPVQLAGLTPILITSERKTEGRMRRRVSLIEVPGRSVPKAVTPGQASMATPLAKKGSFVSQLEGASLKNTCGFKHSQSNLQDAKTLHENQNLTLMSLELHIHTRGKLRPDPDFDPIRALFFCIASENYGEGVGDGSSTEHVGAIVVDNPNKNQIHDAAAAASSRPPLSTYGLPDVKVTSVENEQAMFDEVIRLVREHDPDFLIGYEIQQFSWGYLLDRAAALDVKMCANISRLPDNEKESHFSSEKDAYGASHTSEVNIAGRIVLNIWRLLRHEIALNIYTFENVAYHVLHQRVPLFSLQDLSAWFDHQTHLLRWRVVEHYLYRVLGNLKILKQMDLIGRTSELARLFGIEFFSVLSRGTQFRVESMMLRQAKSQNYVAISPSVQQRATMKAPECVALVMEPESRLYEDPVIVLDFQSLYPSMMIGYNYCFSTCLGRVEHIAKGGHFVLGCTTHYISPSQIKRLLDSGSLHVSPNGVVFVKKNVRPGILPRMLEQILNTRIMVKKGLKDHKDDKVLQRMLDNRQLGLKLIANVTYGYTSASFSGRMPCIEVGDSIVMKARETLERAIHLVETTSKWGAKVVYGDTDSMFVMVKGASKERAFEVGREIVAAVSKVNPKPVKLKLEKVYKPCVLQAKKRYVGFMYETPDQKEPELDAKGIETIRRDSCPAVAKILEKALKIVFTTQNVSQVKRYVQKQFQKIIDGRINLQDLVFAKEYRGRQTYKPGACVPALELTKRSLAVDKRSEPRVGERVPYVIVNGVPGLPLIQLVRRPGELTSDPTLIVNSTYYITRQIVPALNRVFGIMGVETLQWYEELPRNVRSQATASNQPNRAKKGTISQYFSSLNCVICDQLTKTGLCGDCRKQPQLVTAVLGRRIQDHQRAWLHLTKICRSCTGFPEPEPSCISNDCPIRHQLTRTQRRMNSIPQLVQLVEEMSAT